QSIERGDIDERAASDIASFDVRTDLRAKHLLEKRQEGLIRFRHEYEHGGERFTMPGTEPPSLWFVFDVDVFKGSPGRMRVEVHYQLNMQDLRYGWADSVYTASYRAEGVMLDRNAREAARDEYTEKLTASDFRTTMAAQLIPGQLDFDVPEGGYRLAIRL